MLRRRRSRRLLHTVAVITVIVCVFGAVEFALRSQDRVLNLDAYRLSRPEPYKTSPYLSPEFVAEYHQLGTHSMANGYWQHNDFHGHWYTFENGVRRTVGQPSLYDRTVWLFGNSGLEDPFVPDDYTMATQLQGLLNHDGYRWRIVNLGVGGLFVSGELAYLKDTPIHAGDIVIFYDGSRDATSMVEDRGPVCRGLMPITDALETIKYLCSLLPSDTASIQVGVARYLHTVAAARQYAQAHGATFYHFLQAYIDDSVDPIYALMAADKSPHITAPHELFIDTAHLAERGNAIIAHALSHAILPTF